MRWSLWDGLSVMRWMLSSVVTRIGIGMLLEGVFEVSL